MLTAIPGGTSEVDSEVVSGSGSGSAGVTEEPSGSRLSRLTVITIVVVVATRAMSRLRRESSRQSVITVELIQFIIQYRAKETQEKKKRCCLIYQVSLKQSQI